MKRFWQTVPVLCFSLALLTVPALADIGPKPLLTVRVENAPEELYYLDILAEGPVPAPSDRPHFQPDDGKRPEDEDLLASLRAAVPEGWHACLAQGHTPPVWGELAGEPQNGVMLHTFRYVGVPPRYRLLAVTASGDIWLSQVTERPVLQSTVTVDWAAGTLTTPPAWRAYVLQFLATLLPTLAIEGVLLLLFGFPWKPNRTVFLLANLGTQIALFLLLGVPSLVNGRGLGFLLLFFPAELAVLVVETLVYHSRLTGKSPARAMLYGIAANAASAAAGWFLAEPLWDFLMSIS